MRSVIAALLLLTAAPAAAQEAPVAPVVQQPGVVVGDVAGAGPVRRKGGGDVRDLHDWRPSTAGLWSLRRRLAGFSRR